MEINGLDKNENTFFSGVQCPAVNIIGVILSPLLLVALHLLC